MKRIILAMCVSLSVNAAVAQTADMNRQPQHQPAMRPVMPGAPMRPIYQNPGQPLPIGAGPMYIRSDPAIAYFNPLYTPCIPGGCL